ncbi:hypothetical protein DVT68_12070 [Dyella solisilvae]|uniref:Uncharacterized protein n=1 Tax=Dyella solisilvae TaxID=1920168 RepID=A0A370KA30_9GAMM|nr:hypothetical protein [Dyella solisilvae]RDI99287.1 hypothetical protein DVT68_12070 [Dyella solisilvae]
MPDLVIRHIDSLMAERIKALAKERQWSINDVVLHALRHGLGMASTNLFAETMLDPGDLTTLAGQWDAKEKAAFQEAVQALSRTPATQLARVNLPLEDDN